MLPAAARMYLESLNRLMTEGPEQLANGRLNPPNHWIYQILELWQKDNFGTLKTEPDFIRCLEFLINVDFVTVISEKKVFV